MKFLLMLWMIVGVIGFPGSVGWFLYRWQKYARAKTDKEKLDMRERVRKAGILILVTAIILVGFILFVKFGGGEDLIQ